MICPLRLAFLLLLVFVSGCSGVRTAGGLLPQYAAAQSSATVLSTPDYRLADEPDLNGFLADITGSLMRHDWRRLAYSFDPEIYAEQFTFMNRANAERPDADVVAQILAETIGLGMVDNNLSGDGARDQENPFAGLNRIRNVEFTGVDLEATEFRQVDGIVMLEDGTSRSVSFSVFQNAEGDWRIEVPVG